MSKKQAIKSELAVLARIRKNRAARMRRYRARLKAEKNAPKFVVAQDGEMYPAEKDF